MRRDWVRRRSRRRTLMPKSPLADTAWCADRLRELESRPSLLNQLWYAGSYALGAVAGLRGDEWRLGF
ncbi:hypothetical protein D0A35_21930, partial [Xanthomonas campestris]